MGGGGRKEGEYMEKREGEGERKRDKVNVILPHNSLEKVSRGRKGAKMDDDNNCILQFSALRLSKLFNVMNGDCKMSVKLDTGIQLQKSSDFAPQKIFAIIV